MPDPAGEFTGIGLTPSGLFRNVDPPSECTQRPDGACSSKVRVSDIADCNFHLKYLTNPSFVYEEKAKGKSSRAPPGNLPGLAWQRPAYLEHEGGVRRGEAFPRHRFS